VGRRRRWSFGRLVGSVRSIGIVIVGTKQFAASRAAIGTGEVTVALGSV
jgi:hypothetical protein